TPTQSILKESGNIVEEYLHNIQDLTLFSARNPEIHRLLGLSPTFPASNPEIRRLLGVSPTFPASNPEIRRLLGVPTPFFRSQP
ncbi:hypothetical protein, partial [Alkalihalobacillus pseudalcaliphilus]|uniref:hypothetical protein n=1 Tax=Alkalihalobacillus pseudalcaliphilus TaxID=79884 RepID=UPI00235E7982